MKIDRTKNTIKNVIFGFLNKFITILFPFAIRTIIINVLGVQYLGLGSLFTSILNILSLAELGFGTALVYSMYKPIAEDDTETVNALLNLYKKIYRIVGIVVLVLGICFMPFLDNLIEGSYPNDINLYSLYIIYLLNTVISYFFFAYRNSLLSAHQRNDITSKINIVVSVCLYLCQIIVLLLFKNYYVYIIFLPLSTLAINICTLIVTKKVYPQYFCKGSISSDNKKIIKKQIYSLFLHRIGYVIQSSIDNICISAFMGLALLGKFNNYYYIMSSIQAFITIFKQSILAGVGNSVIVENKEYNKKYFNKILFLLAWIVGWCATCFMCLYQPFMHLWVGQENMLSITVVISIVILFYVNEIRGAVGVFKDALGMWYEDRFKPASISIVNLVLTIIFAYIGWFEGIILATAAAYLFVGIPWETKVLFKYYMDEKPLKYIRKQLFYLMVNSLAIFVTYFVCSFIKLAGIKEIIVRFIVCLIVPNIIFIILNLLNSDFRELLKNFKKGEGFMGKIKNLLKKVYHKVPRKINDPDLRMINKRYNKFLKLEKEYSSYINYDIKCDDKVSDYVFTCWLQGEENAPELVKVCFQSMRKHFKNKKFVIITADNFNDYIDLPDYIINKWKSGIISNTHFSDLIRVQLIVKHGGLWIDSTVLCTGNLDKYVNEKTELFVFNNEQKFDKAICLSNWLIYAKSNNPILVNTRDLMFKYWKKHDGIIDYFIFHIMFTICAKHLKDDWKRVPYFTNIDPHVLWFYSFYEPFDQERFNQIKQMSNFHKLSYKFDPKLLKEDSFYEHLIRGDYE